MNMQKDYIYMMRRGIAKEEQLTTLHQYSKVWNKYVICKMHLHTVQGHPLLLKDTSDVGSCKWIQNSRRTTEWVSPNDIKMVDTTDYEKKNKKDICTYSASSTVSDIAKNMQLNRIVAMTK